MTVPTPQVSEFDTLTNIQLIREYGLARFDTGVFARSKADLDTAEGKAQADREIEQARDRADALMAAITTRLAVRGMA